MQIALVHDHYDQDHLEKVIEEMKVLGTPSIKAVWSEAYGFYCAIEGCHRIRAAKALGLVPEIVEVDESDDIAPGTDPTDGITISRIVDRAYSKEIVEFED
jgi:hypothetical protein